MNLVNRKMSALSFQLVLNLVILLIDLAALGGEGRVGLGPKKSKKTLFG